MTTMPIQTPINILFIDKLYMAYLKPRNYTILKPLNQLIHYSHL